MLAVESIGILAGGIANHLRVGHCASHSHITILGATVVFIVDGNDLLFDSISTLGASYTGCLFRRIRPNFL